MRIGFESFTEFAPVGWRVPAAVVERDRTASALAKPETWARIAVSDNGSAGHISFNPAREASPDQPRDQRPLIPGLVHLWQLFVRPEWWGRGVANALHATALPAMRERGYASARLFTPTGQARARHFYERRGWEAVGEIEFADLGLPMTEYRLDLR